MPFRLNSDYFVCENCKHCKIYQSDEIEYKCSKKHTVVMRHMPMCTDWKDKSLSNRLHMWWLRRHGTIF